MKYYCSTTFLDRLVDDPTVDIRDVVVVAEHLVRTEAVAAEYYRNHPDLLHEGHPWVRFINDPETVVFW